MSCITCGKSIELPVCIDSITLGTIESDAVFVYLRNHSTKRLIRLETIPDAEGLLTIDVTGIRFNPNQAYEIYVTDLDSTSMGTRLEITSGEDTFTCINASFIHVYNADNTNTTYY